MATTPAAPAGSSAATLAVAPDLGPVADSLSQRKPLASAMRLEIPWLVRVSSTPHHSSLSLSLNGSWSPEGPEPASRDEKLVAGEDGGLANELVSPWACVTKPPEVCRHTLMGDRCTGLRAQLLLSRPPDPVLCVPSPGQRAGVLDGE